MNSTIYGALENALKQNRDEIYFLIGHNRHYVVGDVALRLKRERFPNGMLTTLPKFARVRLVVWMNDNWVPVDRINYKTLYLWNTPITVLS